MFKCLCKSPYNEVILYCCYTFPSIQICQHTLSGDVEYTVADHNEQIFKDTSTGQNAGKYYVQYAGPESR